MSQCSWCHKESTTHVNIDKRKGRYHGVPVCEDHARAREADNARLAAEAEAKKKARRR